MGDPVDNVQNGTAPAANSADATPGVTTRDNRVSSQIVDKRRTLIADAVSALQESYTALYLLTAGDTRADVTALARATGKLDIVLAADPGLAQALSYATRDDLDALSDELKVI